MGPLFRLRGSATNYVGVIKSNRSIHPLRSSPYKTFANEKKEPCERARVATEMAVSASETHTHTEPQTLTHTQTRDTERFS